MLRKQELVKVCEIMLEKPDPSINQHLEMFLSCEGSVAVVEECIDDPRVIFFFCSALKKSIINNTYETSATLLLQNFRSSIVQVFRQIKKWRALLYEKIRSLIFRALIKICANAGLQSVTVKMCCSALGCLMTELLRLKRQTGQQLRPYMVENLQQIENQSRRNEIALRIIYELSIYLEEILPKDEKDEGEETTASPSTRWFSCLKWGPEVALLFLELWDNIPTRLQVQCLQCFTNLCKVFQYQLDTTEKQPQWLWKLREHALRVIDSNLKSKEHKDIQMLALEIWLINHKLMPFIVTNSVLIYLNQLSHEDFRNYNLMAELVHLLETILKLPQTPKQLHQPTFYLLVNVVANCEIKFEEENANPVSLAFSVAQLILNSVEDEKEQQDKTVQFDQILFFQRLINRLLQPQRSQLQADKELLTFQNYQHEKESYQLFLQPILSFIQRRELQNLTKLQQILLQFTSSTMNWPQNHLFMILMILASEIKYTPEANNTSKIMNVKTEVLLKLKELLKDPTTFEHFLILDLLVTDIFNPDFLCTDENSSYLWYYINQISNESHSEIIEHLCTELLEGISNLEEGYLIQYAFDLLITISQQIKEKYAEFDQDEYQKCAKPILNFVLAINKDSLTNFDFYDPRKKLMKIIGLVVVNQNLEKLFQFYTNLETILFESSTPKAFKFFLTDLQGLLLASKGQSKDAKQTICELATQTLQKCLNSFMNVSQQRKLLSDQASMRIYLDTLVLLFNKIWGKNVHNRLLIILQVLFFPTMSMLHEFYSRHAQEHHQLFMDIYISYAHLLTPRMTLPKLPKSLDIREKSALELVELYFLNIGLAEDVSMMLHLIELIGLRQGFNHPMPTRLQRRILWLMDVWFEEVFNRQIAMEFDLREVIRIAAEKFLIHPGQDMAKSTANRLSELLDIAVKCPKGQLDQRDQSLY